MSSLRISFLLLVVGLVTAVILSSSGSLTAEESQLEPYIVKDIYMDVASTDLECGATIGQNLICGGEGGLWKTNGTQEGSELLAEVWVYRDSINEKWMLNFNNKVFFLSDGLWATDGTPSGTGKVQDGPQTGWYVPEHSGQFTSTGSLFFFVSSMESGEYQYALWRSDGTTTGTYEIFESENNIFEMVNFNDQLFFSLENALWKSDGTAAGTVKVKDIWPTPRNLTVVGDKLYMGTEYNGLLWLSDGTTDGTNLFTDRVSPNSLVAFDGYLYFWGGGFEGSPDYLWRTNGTSEGTQKIIESKIPYDVISVESFFYFFPEAYHVPAELWRSDGTPEGTFSLNATFPETNYDNYFKGLVTTGNRLYFAGYDEKNGVEPWTSDGSLAGTDVLKDIFPGIADSNPHSFHMLGNKVYFSARSDPNHSALWTSNGDPNDTEQAVTLQYQEVHKSEPSSLTAVDSLLFFSAKDGIHGSELWISDGRVTGTNLVKDIEPSTASSSPLWGYPGGAALDGELLFTAYDRAELWKSDGSESGTIPIWILADSGTSKLSNIWAGESVAYLFTENGLWVTNGQVTGHTHLLETDGFPLDQVVEGDRLYLSIYSSGEAKLITSTGTVASTIQLYDGQVEGLCILDGLAYFGTGEEMWQSDGTIAGTKQIVTLKSAEIKDLACSVDKIFISHDGNSDWSLWVSDGSQAGTSLLKSIEFESEDERIYNLIPFNTGVIFVAADGVHGYELWISDGTELGTNLVMDIYPGTNSSWVEWITTAGDVAFFGARDGVHGKELWVTNGTEEGTNLVNDIVPPGQGGPYWCSGDGSCPSELTINGNRLFFYAEEGDGDVELWALDLVPLPPAAEFSALPNFGLAPLDVSFKNLSSGVFDNCLWNFGDGNTETDCGDQMHTYSDSGVYSVSLSISGPGGEDNLMREACINSDIQGVTADFSVTPANAIAPLTVSIINLSKGDFDTCSWSFGDGETAADCGSQSHTYEKHGIFTVSLTVNGPGGIDTKIISEAIIVYEPVTADFRATPISGKPPLVVKFDNQSIGDFDTCAWAFGDGQTGSLCTGQLHIYTTGGVYDVSLMVSGTGGKDTKTKEDLITVEIFRVFMPSVLGK